MIRFQRPLPQQQVCGPCKLFFTAAVLALLAALSLTRVAMASDRSVHLHAVSHGGGHLAAPRDAHGKPSSRSHPSITPKEQKPGAKNSKSGHSSKASPSEKAHGKASRRRRPEPEAVDDPITVHRADARPLSRKAATRERLLAREHGSTARSVAKNRRGHAELAEAVRNRDASSRWAKGPASDPRSAVQRNLGAPRSIVLAGNSPNGPAPFHPRTATATSQSAEAYRQVESHPDDDVSTLQNAATAARQAARSVVVRSQADNEGQISALPATQPTGVPSPRVISGFGAEVAVAPAGPAHYTARSPSAEAMQQQMDIADDAGQEKLSVASPRALAEEAMQPMVLPLYTRSGKLVMPAPLRGSREILVHQNTMADHDGLERIRDDRELNRLRQERMLVSFPESSSLRVNYGLPENRRYARPWTVRFATDAARAFYAQFGEALQVNSAVRTVSYQRKLQRVNGNAAATNGDGASPHLTGQAIDLAKRGMTSEEIGWMRTYLLPLIEAGKVDVEEEFQQACFHISVYRAYAPAPKKQSAPKLQVAQLRAEPKSVRAAATALTADEANDQ